MGAARVRKVRAADPVAGDARRCTRAAPTHARSDTCSLSTHVRDASNFAGFPEPRGVAAVVCSGVTMYFPSASYLVEVLANGLPKLRRRSAARRRGGRPGSTTWAT